MSKLDAALAYAARGWAVLPLNGKLPAIAKVDGGRGVHDATTDEATIRRWWTKDPHANVGVAGGAVSGFWVLDIDGAVGEESLAELQRTHESLPETVEQLTGRGRHLLFKYNGDAIKNAVAFRPGLDTRSDGGYIVVEPSYHQGARRTYQWEVSHHPDEVEPANAPEWLVKLVTEKPAEPVTDPYLAFAQAVETSNAYGETALESEAEAVMSAPIGSQESTLNAAALKVGGLVGAGLLEYDVARERLIVAGVTMTNDPSRAAWTNDAVAAKVDRGLRDGMVTPRQIAAAPEPTVSSLPDISMADCARWVGVEPDPLNFVIDDYVPQSMVTLMAAEGGAGKTLLCQLAISCVLSGEPFLSKTTTGGAGAGIFAEDPDVVLHHRQIRINEALGLADDALVGRAFIQSYFGTDAALWQNGRPTPFAAELEHQLGRIDELRLLCIDNVALVYRGNENDRTEVTAFLSWLNGVADRLRVGVILTAHQSKSTDGSSLRAASGSTAWINAARSVLGIKSGDEPELIHVKANHARRQEPLPLVWRDAVLMPESPGGTVERIRRRTLDKLIFEKVNEGWHRDMPYSISKQSGPRYLPAHIARTSEFKAREIQAAVVSWIDSGHLVTDRKSTKYPSGLRIERAPDLAE